MKSAFCTFCLILILFLNSFANDSLTIEKFEFKKFDTNFNSIETQTDNIDEFFIRDIFFNSSNVPIGSVGNVASPILNLSPFGFFHSGFEILPNYYNNYFFNGDHLFFLNKALTSIKFSLGSKREQNIAFFHSQNFGKRFNFFARSQNFRSDGFYRNQTSRSNSFDLGFSFYSKNKKFFTDALISSNKIYNRENGGIIDSLFLVDATIEKSLIEVNLLQASNSFRNNRLSITNRYIPNNLNDLFADTLFSRFYFYHTINFQEQRRYYLDSLANDFYGANNYSSVSSTDFIYNRNIVNKIGVFYGGKLKYINCWLSNPIDYVSTYFDSFNNVGLDLNVDLHKKIGLFSAKFFGKYFFSGYNRNDYVIRFGVFKSSMNNRFIIGLNSELLKSSPFFLYNNFFSNRNSWNNNFDKENFFKLGLTASYKKLLSFDCDYFSLKNLILFNQSNLPSQFENDLINYYRFSVSANLSKKHFASLSTINFQKPLNSSLSLNLPVLFFRERVRFLFNSFKRNLASEIGLDFVYSSKTYGWTYIPSVSVFVLSNRSFVLGYPRLDFVYDFKVRNLSGYFRVDNVLSGFTGDLYYTLDGFPMPDRTIRLGIIWTFIDDKFIEKKE
jgi:hypothetical protein